MTTYDQAALDTEVWHRFGRGCNTLAEAYAKKAGSDGHRAQWKQFGDRHQMCCYRDSIDAIAHDHADALRFGSDADMCAQECQFTDMSALHRGHDHDDSTAAERDCQHADALRANIGLSRPGPDQDRAIREAQRAGCVAVSLPALLDDWTDAIVEDVTRRGEPVRYGIRESYDLAREEDDRRTRARKIERTWRGEITPERIAADEAAAYATYDVDHRCRTCGEHFSDPHAIGCPADPTYVPEEPDDDQDTACHCGHPDCGAC
jgi:hypothetical protein